MAGTAGNLLYAPASLCSAPHLPLFTGKGTKRLLSQAGSDPRKLVPGPESEEARIILLDTPAVSQHGVFSHPLCMSLSLGWGKQG